MSRIHLLDWLSCYEAGERSSGIILTCLRENEGNTYEDRLIDREGEKLFLIGSRTLSESNVWRNEWFVHGVKETDSDWEYPQIWTRLRKYLRELLSSIHLIILNRYSAWIKCEQTSSSHIGNLLHLFIFLQSSWAVPCSRICREYDYTKA